MSKNLAAWQAYMDGHDPEILRSMLAQDAVFHSPVVHTPQRGKDIAVTYLTAANHVFAGTDFQYVDEIVSADGTKAMLEFTAEIDGIHINGVDIIHWNDDGQIVQFKVMVRPLKAINKIWDKMAAMLEKNSG